MFLFSLREILSFAVESIWDCFDFMIEMSNLNALLPILIFKNVVCSVGLFYFSLDNKLLVSGRIFVNHP